MILTNFRQLFLIIFMAGMTLLQAYATSKQSAEEQRVHNLSEVLQVFAQNHQNKLPGTWSELNTYIPLDGLGSPPIQERYTLAPNAPASEELAGDQVLAIGRIPFSDDVQNGEGRFVIYRTKDGQYQSGWYPDAEVQKIITETQLTVPPQTVPQPSIPTRPPHEPMTKEQYDLLKKSGLLSSNQEVPIIDSTNSTLSNQPQKQKSASSGDTSTPGASSPSSTPSSSQSIAEVTPSSVTGTSVWLYGVIVLGVGLIGILWYRSRPK
jgi:hypothetical protein